MLSNRRFSLLKSLILPKDKKIVRIPLGLFKGITFNVDFMSQSQLYLGLWERETYSHMYQLSRNIKTAIDIGAGKGEQTLYFLYKTSADKIFSFEPSEDSCNSLKENINLNHNSTSKSLRIIKKAVCAKNSNFEISLDSLWNEISFPCFVKMDIDGGEVEALNGAIQFLSGNYDVRWLIETHSYELEKECIRILSRNRFHYKIIYNAWWRKFIPEQRPIEMNRWLVAYKQNMTDKN